jgi:hypothetical protein
VGIINGNEVSKTNPTAKDELQLESSFWHKLGVVDKSPRNGLSE